MKNSKPHMITIPVNLPSRGYSIHVGHGILDQLGTILHGALPVGQILVVTDEQVKPLYLDKALAALTSAGFEARAFVVPAGEMNKSMEQAQRLWNFLIDGGYTRSSALLALGGGVVSDLTGFVAATFMRGVAFAVAPTSMMGQLDAAIGGKTAINLPQAKNIVGVFHQPRAVVTDTALLTTLPQRELASGLGEAVKYGLLIGEDFFTFLERHAGDILALEAKALTHTLKRCIRFKADLIVKDELDQGDRMILNLGHTLGHSLEKLGRYERYRHGEAVALGLEFATWLSDKLGTLQDSALPQRVRNLLTALQLPTSIEHFDSPAIVETMTRDKKVCHAGRVRFILPVRCGATVNREIPVADLAHYVQTFQTPSADRPV